MLSYEELEKIVLWKPYRSDWPVDRNLVEDNISKYFDLLFQLFKINKNFKSEVTQNGGMTNYIEIVCYNSESIVDNSCILVCISVCCPYAAYGQTYFNKTDNSLGWGFLDSEKVGIIDNGPLKIIEQEVLEILTKCNLNIVGNTEASQKLPAELVTKVDSLYEGDSLIHGLFQYMD